MLRPSSALLLAACLLPAARASQVCESTSDVYTIRHPGEPCGSLTLCVNQSVASNLTITGHLLALLDDAYDAGIDVTRAYCDIDGLCKERVGRGGRCTFNGGGTSPDVDECEPDHTCVGLTGKSRCRRQLKAGTSCEDANFADNGEDVCAPSTECKSGTCKATAYGALCSSDDGCDDLTDGTCEDGVCVREFDPSDKKGSGETCDEDDDCKSRLCRWDKEDCGKKASCDNPGTDTQLSTSGLSCDTGACDTTAECVSRRSVKAGDWTAGPSAVSHPEMCRSGAVTSSNGFCANESAVDGVRCASATACAGTHSACLCGDGDTRILGYGTCGPRPCDKEQANYEDCLLSADYARQCRGALKGVVECLGVIDEPGWGALRGRTTVNLALGAVGFGLAVILCVCALAACALFGREEVARRRAAREAKEARALEEQRKGGPMGLWEMLGLAQAPPAEPAPRGRVITATAGPVNGKGTGKK